jgi:hypothetical protein
MYLVRACCHHTAGAFPHNVRLIPSVLAKVAAITAPRDFVRGNRMKTAA